MSNRISTYSENLAKTLGQEIFTQNIAVASWILIDKPFELGLNDNPICFYL